jgi:uncharacterized protein (DUF305 family)
MNGSSPRLLAVLLAGASLGCSSGTVGSGVQPATPGEPTIAVPGRQPYTEADVQFMAGMIPHHAQAILIAGWAPTHGASRPVLALAERIVVAQQDEILIMQTWLRDRGQKVPAADATHHKMVMNGVEHDMLMPGMLNAEELAQLDKARGTEFDRLFLTYMIRHHAGAVSMVDKLHASDGAVQDEVVFKLTSDIYADQTTEIDRMQKILAALPGS